MSYYKEKALNLYDLSRRVWRGRNVTTCYELESEEEVHLSTQNRKYITNEKGEVEISKYMPDDDGYYMTLRRSHGKTLEHYYPYPYFPNKPIKAFRIRRMLMHFQEYTEYPLIGVENKHGHMVYYIQSDIKPDVKFQLVELFAYPEFFTPIY